MTLGCIRRRTAPKLGADVRLALILLVSGGWGLYSTAARSQTLNEKELEQADPAKQSPAGNWNATLGAGVAAVPSYPGASAHRARAIPLVSITYRDLAFLGPFGLGLNALDRQGFRAGPVLGFEGGRKHGDDPHLNGLEDIQESATAGLFAAYRFGPFEIFSTARQAVTHTNNGLSGLVQLNYRVSIIQDKLDFIVGPEVEMGDRKYTKTWFGVTPTQSASSGLAAFSPGAGVTDAGLHMSLTYHYTDHILLQTFADVKELTGDSADSPIVQNKTQAIVGIGAAYHF